MFKYTALIVEPRRHRALQFVLNNFLKNLSEEWGFIIFHGDDNADFVKDILHQLDNEDKDRIANVINMHVDNYNAKTYSHLFMSASFYDHIPTDTFLVFQTDSIILKENKNKLYSFLDYDYVGAPWRWDCRVGNGGLSIRKKSKMLEIIHFKGYQDTNEDLYFSQNIDNSIHFNLPSWEIAKEFSVETLFYEYPFGVHNIWRYITTDELNFLQSTYPDIKTLMELQ